MAPLIEVSEEILNTLNPDVYTRRDDLILNSQEDNYIYIPSINLYVAKERTLQGADWFDAHRELQKNGERMLTILEFVEVLKYTKDNFLEIYEDITAVRSPWRAEWLDADFKVKNGELYVNSSHQVDKKGNLIPQSSKPLTKNTLRQNKKISLEAWLNNPTAQGFPRKNISKGDLHYFRPLDDNNSVARLDAGSVRAFLYCNRYPSSWNPGLGVRAAKLRE